MSDSLFAFFAGVLLATIGTFIFLDVFGDYTIIYKDGQVDCLNGEIHYQLVKQENGTTQWERIDE